MNPVLSSEVQKSWISYTGTSVVGNTLRQQKSQVSGQEKEIVLCHCGMHNLIQKCHFFLVFFPFFSVFLEQIRFSRIALGFLNSSHLGN